MLRNADGGGGIKFSGKKRYEGVKFNVIIITRAGLDIGYVPAGPDAFLRWSGQFGPQQLIFYWPGGPVDFFFFFFF